MLQAMKNKMQMRKLTADDDLEQYNDLLRYAFQVTEKQLLEYGWENDDIRQSKLPVLKQARVLGWFDQGRLASQFAVYPLKMNIFNRICRIGFITSVATYPEYTGLGLMSGLMRRSLEEMRDLGEYLAILYPFSIPLYRHRGWEIISDKMSFRIKDNQLPRKIQAGGYVRRVDPGNPDLKRLHNIFAAQTHGCLIRNELAWEEYWRWDVDDTTIAIYYDEESSPTGYMVYLIKDNIMHIKEMIYLDTNAWRGLWKYISAHESMVDEVTGSNYSNDSIAFWLEDSDIRETIRPYIMGRIVDVEQFLKQYRFNNCRGGEKFTLQVRDPFLEWNNRSFSIAAESDGSLIVEKGESVHPVELDIGTLTTLLLSYKSPASLQRMDRLKTDPDTLNLLERLIPSRKAYISDYI